MVLVLFHVGHYKRMVKKNTMHKLTLRDTYTLGMYLYIFFPLYRSYVTKRTPLHVICFENLLYFFTQCVMDIFLMLYNIILLQHMAALSSIVFIFPKLLLLDIWLLRFFIIIKNAVMLTQCSIGLRVWDFEYAPSVINWSMYFFKNSISSALKWI